MEVVNPVLEEYLKTLNSGRRSFGVLLCPEEITCLDDLGLNDYETEPTADGRVYVKVYIKTG